jgi:dihydroorotase
LLSQSKLLLQQVRVIDPLSDTDRIADVFIVGDRIEAIEPHLDPIPQDASVYEAQGLILAPGLVDLYSYSGEPGHEERETLASLAAAASAGGFTRIAILPNTIPAIDNPATLALLRQKAEGIFKAEGRRQKAEGSLLATPPLPYSPTPLLPYSTSGAL